MAWSQSVGIWQIHLRTMFRCLMLVRTSWPAADISAVTAWAHFRAARPGVSRPVMSSSSKMCYKCGQVLDEFYISRPIIIINSFNLHNQIGSTCGITRHPLLGVIMCMTCKRFYKDGSGWQEDEDGCDKYCRWCGQGGELILCDKQYCPAAFCTR